MIPDLKPGDRLSVYVGDQPSGAAENRQRRVGERPYMGALRFGQRLFAILFRDRAKIAEFRRFAAAFACARWWLAAGFQRAIND